MQERFLQRVVWIMESRLGVRAADAKTPSHYHYMYPPTLSPVCVGLQHHSKEHYCAAEEVGQRDRRHLNHWSGSPLDRSVCIEMLAVVGTSMQSATRGGGLASACQPKGGWQAWQLPSRRRNAAFSAMEMLLCHGRRVPTTTLHAALHYRALSLNPNLTKPNYKLQR